jgi:TolB-like protein/Tfp pilus assembly protein PilF
MPEMTDGGDDKTARGDAPTVFVSYASQDAAVANAIVAALEHSGLKCWIAPRDVVPGEFYADAIVRAIDAAKAIVLTLSQNACASPHILREVERASSKGRPVVSFRIDLSPMPSALEYFLNSSHWLDATAAGVDRALPTLVDAVHRAVSPGSAMQLRVPDAAAATARKSASSHGAAGTGRPRLTRALGVIATVTALGLALFAADGFWLDRHVADSKADSAARSAETSSVPAAPVIVDRSVAVLPFVDMSEKKDQEYFADGLAEELLDMLSRVPELRVAARTSAFSFKGKSDDIPTIARKLLVANVLEGSVRKAGRHLRVTAQLVRADNGYHVWSETYDRELNDVFKIQDEIASAVVKSLKISLLTGGAPTGSGTLNVEANDLFLQASYLFSQLSASGTTQAVDLLRRALAVDPRFARAWAELSRSRHFQVGNHLIPEAETDAALAEARSAAQKAVDLDGALPEAHVALGRIYEFDDKDNAKATAEFRRALELNPRSSDALLQLGNAAADAGRLDEGNRLREQALAMDPLNVNILQVLGQVYYEAGQAAKAEPLFRKELDLSPDSMFAADGLGLSLVALGRPAEALGYLERSARDNHAKQQVHAALYPALGRQAEAAESLAAFERDPTTEPADVAWIFALRGDMDRTVDWLERQEQANPKSFSEVVRGFIYAAPQLKDNPRYKALLRRVKSAK